MTHDEAQRRPSTLSFDLLRTVSEAEPLRAVSLSNGRWTFYEAVNFINF